MSRFSQFKIFLREQMAQQNFEAVAVSVVDFVGRSVVSCELAAGEEIPLGEGRHFFDLASLTKPLTFGPLYLRSPEWFTPQMLWLLDHRGGLPSGGRLPKNNWREIINRLPLQYSPTLYSDFSALRLQLMLEEYLVVPWEQYLAQDWGSQIYFWPQLPPGAPVLCSGQRGGKAICGQVHDDNCFYLKDFTAHAGLFATVNGLAECLIGLNEHYQLLSMMNERVKLQEQRFVGSWDTTRDADNSLAGTGSGRRCFGHLGFTGTSMWIDPERKLGQIILTNATRSYWYHREGLNSLRRNIGTWIWQNNGF